MRARADRRRRTFGSPNPEVVVQEPSPPKKRRRRPSGEPPPLPRAIHRSGKVLLVEAGLVFLVLMLVALSGDFTAKIERLDHRLLTWVADMRTSRLTSLAREIEALGSGWFLAVLRWAAIIALVFFRRFRHLVVFIVSVLLVGFVTTSLSQLFVRARPVDIEIIGSWQGASVPSLPVAALAVTLIAICYSLIVPGRPRLIGKIVARVAITLLVLARIYLGVDHPTDALTGAILGISIPILAFRLIVPNEVFPVAYGKRGKAAHLDVEGERGEAIRSALERQLGVTITDMQPFGLAGSAGSTPLLLTVAGEPVTFLFAKLYASNHLRADRLYKLGRTLLYGRLEDETAFSTVRRLVQHEDYMLRAMRDAGVSSSNPHGFVEITPEREYLLVADFLLGAKEILEAEVTDEVIDDALRNVRKLWDAGLAHRDLKPSNILVRGNKVHLIDVAFGQVRPSPWREAVDLANMMLVLALRRDPETVYRLALRYFTPDDIAEAFAATKGVTMPSQTRSLLRKDARRLVTRFRELAPPRSPISIQRWSVRRVLLTGATLIGALIAAGLVLGNLNGAGLVTPPEATQASWATVVRSPECSPVGGEQMILQAQAIPTASLIPCIKSLPAGWSFQALDVRNGSSRFYLDSDRVGLHAVEVELSRSCDLAGATEVPSDILGATRYETVLSLAGGFSGERTYVFRGGCVTERFRFSGETRSVLANEIALGLDLMPRSHLSQRHFETTGLHI